MSKGSPRIAIYPASFDPITLGHVDVATRAAQIFDELIMAVYDRPLKTLMFSTSDRVALTKTAVAHLPNVRIDTYNELTVQYARSVGAGIIVRGLRTVSDFEREYGMAQLNHGLESDIDMVFLMASPRFSFVSSSAVKEIAALGGSISKMVPAHVEQVLADIYGRRNVE